jgi:hypothetical protein
MIAFNQTDIFHPGADFQHRRAAFNLQVFNHGNAVAISQQITVSIFNDKCITILRRFCIIPFVSAFRADEHVFSRHNILDLAGIDPLNLRRDEPEEMNQLVLEDEGQAQIALSKIRSSCELIMGAGVVVLISTVVGEENFLEWGWRIPFFIALPLGIIGLYLRHGPYE